MSEDAEKNLHKAAGKAHKNSRGKKLLAVVLLVLVVIGGAVFVYAAGWLGGFKVAQYNKDDLGVFFIDVGQGDAILIRSPDGRFMMIDAGAGKSADLLVKTLKSYGVKTLDYFVLTHPDEDHVGGAAAILESFDVKAVLASDAGAATKVWRDTVAAIEEEGCAFLTVSAGNVYRFFENCDFKILGPVDVEAASDVNNQSVVLRLDYGKTSFLFTGDAGKEEEQSMLERFDAKEFSADVLKLGHHGSSSSSGQAFLSAVNPRFAVVSCGKNNAYGHPHASVLGALSERNVKVLRTDESGTVILQSDQENVEITSFIIQTPFEHFLAWVKSWFA